jgi:hypothetical protein
MNHKAITQIQERVILARDDSDTAYFISLLCLGEAVLKTITSVMIGAIADDPDRNRYRLEHAVVRASGIGDWGRVLDDCLTGAASQFLIDEARFEQKEFINKAKKGDWQYDATLRIKNSLDALGIKSEDVPLKTSFQRWVLLFATLRNKTRGHGALVAGKCSDAINPLQESLNLIIENSSIFKRSCVYLHQNLSGKYRVSPIAGDPSPFECYKSVTGESLENGIYVHLSKPVKISLIETSAELRDFFFANGGLTNSKFDLISYATGATDDGDAGRYRTPPGKLPPSETEGLASLDAVGNCFINVPRIGRDYVARPELEKELLGLVMDDRHPIVTLVGRGGIGKTSLALATLPHVAQSNRFEAIVWFSSRDIDLQESGPKPVRPHILTQDDVSRYFVDLVAPKERDVKGFSEVEFLQHALGSCPLGPTLFVFDNFETTASPGELFTWIDTYVRNPNKVLITTRLRDFKGDYPIDVRGMTEGQSRELVMQTGRILGVNDILTPEYVNSLISESEGHPYVIKMMIGEVAKEKRAVNVRRLVAGSEEILTALFERTYASLSEASRRVFLTLASWNSAVPRLALEAVLLRPENDRADISEAVELLQKSSMVEFVDDGEEGTVLLNLPLVAREFGKKKLNVSPMKTAILADREILQMLGVHQSGQVGQSALDERLKRFVKTIASKIEGGDGDIEDYRPILEMIARNYNRFWLLLARLYEEGDRMQDLGRAKEAYRRFLENDPKSAESANAWRQLAYLAYHTGDALEELNAFIERSQISSVPFEELSSTANRFNQALHRGDVLMATDERRIVGERLLQALERRKVEALPDDYSRMAWLAMNLSKPAKAKAFVEEGIGLGAASEHIDRLREKLGI